MGSVVGEKLTRLIEASTERELPLIIISTSGGARMYEGMFSLMQMAKTCGALAYHAQVRLPYISVLTDPTTAGVMASFASVGDLILAEPGAMIGFAGPRVIKDTTQAELPPGFQRAEFLLEHGLIDAIVPRKEMKEQLIEYLGFLTGGQRQRRIQAKRRRWSPGVTEGQQRRQAVAPGMGLVYVLASLSERVGNYEQEDQDAGAGGGLTLEEIPRSSEGKAAARRVPMESF
jgi:hypothetical protein